MRRGKNDNQERKKNGRIVGYEERWYPRTKRQAI